MGVRRRCAGAGRGGSIVGTGSSRRRSACAALEGQSAGVAVVRRSAGSRRVGRRFLYPRAGEAEAPGELCGVEQFRAARRAGVDRLAFQAKELDDALGDLLDRVGRQLGGRAPSTCEAPSGTRLAGVCPRWMGVDWAECADGPAPPRWKCRECSHHRPLFVVAVSPHRASAVLAVSRSNRHCAFGPSPMRCPPSRCRCL